MLRGELVSLPANRLDPPWALRIVQLLAQPRDVHITVHELTSLSYCQAILRRRKAQSFRSDVVSAASARVVFAVWHAAPQVFIATNRLKTRPARLSCADTGSRIPAGRSPSKPLCPAGTAHASFPFTLWFEHSLGPARCSPNSPRGFFFEQTLTTSRFHPIDCTLCRAPATRRTASIPARRG